MLFVQRSRGRILTPRKIKVEMSNQNNKASAFPFSFSISQMKWLMLEQLWKEEGIVLLEEANKVMGGSQRLYLAEIWH